MYAVKNWTLTSKADWGENASFRYFSKYIRSIWLHLRRLGLVSHFVAQNIYVFRITGGCVFHFIIAHNVFS